MLLDGLKLTLHLLHIDRQCDLAQSGCYGG